MDIKAMAKAAGLTENDLKGKSLDEQIKLLTKKMKEEKDNIELESAKEYIDNYKNFIPKLKDYLNQSFEIYVKKVGQKKSPTIVRVIGYNFEQKTVVVIFNSKFYEIEDSDLIKTVDEFQVLKTSKTKVKNTKVSDNKKPKK